MPEKKRPPSSETPPPRDTLAILVAAGIDLLQREGLGHGAERISLERAAAHGGIPRATAYRLWKNAGVRPQEAFQTALLCGLSDHLVANDDESTATAEAVMAVLEQAGPLDQLSPRQRAWTLVEVIRVGSGANLMDRSGRPMWRMRAGLLAAAGTRIDSGETGPVAGDVRDALRTAAERTSERYVPLYSAMADQFGLRLRAGYRIEQFALLAACFVEGLALRLPFSTEDVVGVRTPYEEHTGGQWTLFGAGLMGLVREFFEPDPARADLSVDLGLVEVDVTDDAAADPSAIR